MISWLTALRSFVAVRPNIYYKVASSNDLYCLAERNRKASRAAFLKQSVKIVWNSSLLNSACCEKTGIFRILSTASLHLDQFRYLAASTMQSRQLSAAKWNALESYCSIRRLKFFETEVLLKVNQFSAICGISSNIELIKWVISSKFILIWKWQGICRFFSSASSSQDLSCVELILWASSSLCFEFWQMSARISWDSLILPKRKAARPI